MEMINTAASKQNVKELVDTFRRVFLASRTDAEVERLWEGMVSQMYQTKIWWADSWTRQLLATFPRIVSTGIDGISNLQPHELFAALGLALAEDELRQPAWNSVQQQVNACAPLIELMGLTRLLEAFGDRFVRETTASVTASFFPEFVKVAYLAATEGKKAIPRAGGEAKDKEGKKKKAELLNEANKGIAEGRWVTPTACANELQPKFFPDKGPNGSDDPWGTVFRWVSKIFLMKKRSPNADVIPK